MSCCAWVNMSSPYPIFSMMTEDDVEVVQSESVEFQFTGFSIFKRGDRWEVEYFDSEEGTVAELLEDASEQFTEDYEIFTDGAWLPVTVADLQKCKDLLLNKGDN